MEHFLEAVTIGKAEAALAASLFHYNELTIADVKHYLAVQWCAGATSEIIGHGCTRIGTDDCKDFFDLIRVHPRVMKD